MTQRVVIVGAGAAGLTAAIFAARSGAQVTILEAQSRPGKKLLITGNGRCNLTNSNSSLADCYYGSAARLASGLLRKYDAAAALDFFAGLGLLTKEKNGYLYPCSGQADSVLGVLLAELRRLHIKLKLSERVVQITDQGCGAARGEHYRIRTATWTYMADAVILACGSGAAPQTGACDDGRILAEQLGHSSIAACPALVPLICNAPWLSQTAGVRCYSRVSLYRKDSGNAGSGVLLAQESGELQWTKYGVSGIVIFQLSRFVSTAVSGEAFALRIDLLPDYTEQKLTAVLSARASQLGKEPAAVLLRGIVHEKLISVVLEAAGAAAASENNARSGQGILPHIRNLSCSQLSAAEVSVLCRVLKDLQLPVAGTKGFDQAQVCAGGIYGGEVTQQLESRLHQGLYFAGEMLDVDGPCGGYNLQWAWTSGRIAGVHAALKKFL